MRALLKRSLRQMRMEIVLAASVAEARDAMIEEPPDLIVTDYILGDGVGGEVVRFARKLRLLAPALLITATPESILGGDVPLFTDVLRKPFRLSELYDVLEVARHQIRPRLRSGSDRRAVWASELAQAAGDDD